MVPRTDATPIALTFGIDVGTSSTKAVLVDDAGRIHATAVREHAPLRPHPGQVEMDPEIWWSECESLAHELLADRAADVVAIGVSGMGPCVALADEAGRAVRPAILYGVDSRAGVEIDELTAALGGADAVAARTGSALSSQSAGPKIAWIRRHEPEAWARARMLLMPATWLAFRLTGEVVLDHHSASQCGPLYDLDANTWATDWADVVAPGLPLPRLCWPDEIVGRTRVPLASIPPGTPVVAGTIDAWTESVSVGATRPGDLMLMYGTTLFLVGTTLERISSPSMWATAGVSPGVHCIAGGLAASGSLTTWLKELTGGEYADMFAAAERSGRGARGLLALPYFDGERTPILDPDARGVIAGLRLDHGSGDLARALLEATAFAVRHNLETMSAAGFQPTRVIAVGGGTQGPLWPQIVSDVSGLRQFVPEITVGASYGAARLAWRARGADVEGWNPPSRVIEPTPEAADHYDRLYDLYRDLYPATRSIAHALAAASTPRQGANE